jgi:uncharacterized RDD family membrane protein YckC
MQDDNPYAAPDAAIADQTPQERQPIEAAGRWRRFFNWAIDRTCTSLLVFAGMVAYALWLAAHDDEAGLAAMEAMEFMTEWLIGISAMLLYYIAMEGLFGFTIGKLVTGTRVVDEQGGRPSFGRIVGRTFARLIPFEPFSILFCEDDKVRGWHDSLAGTWVVRRRR